MKTKSLTMNNHFERPYAFSSPGCDMFNQTGRMAGRSFSLALNILGNTEKLVSDIVRDSFVVADEVEALITSAWGRAATLNTAIHATPRFTRVFSELIRIIASYRIHAVKARFSPPARAERSLEKLHQRNAARIYDLCVEMRGGLIKIGQFASTYMNVLPPAYSQYLSLLQDRVPPVPFEAIIHRIESEFNRPADQVFAWIDPEPVAAASLAQVHRAQLPDGTNVVIKVQMPAIEHTAEIDLAAFKTAADMMNHFFPALGLPEISRALTDSVRKELNYQEELANIHYFKRHINSDPRVVVPKVYPEASTPRVLTMERLEGERLSPFLETASPERRNRLLTVLAESFCSQIVGHGFFHADPHPGNIFVLSDDRLGLIDFGCVECFSPEIHALYTEMIAAILTGNAVKTARLFADMGFTGEADTNDSLHEMATDFIELLMLQPGQSLADVDQAQKLATGLELIQKYPSIRVPRHFVLLGRVLLTLGGIMMSYNPDINVFLLMFNQMSRNRHEKKDAVMQGHGVPCPIG